jgi:hypothetical protein
MFTGYIYILQQIDTQQSLKIDNTEVTHIYWLHLYPPTDRHPTKPKNR